MKENILAVLLTVACGLAVGIPAAPAAEFDRLMLFMAMSSSASDFGKNTAAIIKFVEPYFPEAARKDLHQGGFKIKHTDYDWALNEWRK